jgi:hypothetical protein
MGLDIFVMPMSRYLAGEFQTPAEKLGAVRAGSPKPSADLEKAKQTVSRIQQDLTQATGALVSWPDDGEIVLESQFFRESWHLLRAYAAHLDYPRRAGLLRRKLRFVIDDSPEQHPGIGRIWDGARSRFRHMVIHTDCDGFWLPCDFARPISLDPDTGRVLTGSSVRLLEELDIVGRPLLSEDESFHLIKHAWKLLLDAAQLSVKHRLPVVFDG